MEKEEDGKIAFLEVLVEKKGTLATTSIFHKNTPTDRYMNYDFHHHARIKTSIIKCLGTRVKNVCHATKLIGEQNHLKQVFQANGYAAQMVNWTLRDRSHAPHSSTRTEEQEQTTPPKFLHLPYVRGASERIERRCQRRLGIRTAFKSKGTLREVLLQTKDPQRVEEERSHVPCAECESVYIGETGRTLEKRISEHKRAVKRHYVKNGIAVHSWTKQDKVDWQAATVKHVETNHSRRKTIEALHIHPQRETSTFDCRTVSPVWHLLL